jgi:hypothetical protein
MVKTWDWDKWRMSWENSGRASSLVKKGFLKEKTVTLISLPLLLGCAKPETSWWKGTMELLSL